jgi:carbon monoxide dehydrogenase subunit G
MELEHSFTVPVPMERAWDVLLDVERVAPCMPGASLDSVTGDEIAGRIKVKVGPITMTYAGNAKFTERDKDAGAVTLEASGKETRGAGTASASVRSQLSGDGDSTHVVVHTTLNVTGKPAQFGRGVMAEVGGKLIGIFADNLAAMLAAEPGPDRTPESAAADRAAAESAAADSVGGEPAEPVADTGTGEDTEDDDAELAGAVESGGGTDDRLLPIDVLNLPLRTWNSLRRDGIQTLGDLVRRTSEQLLGIDGIGPASVAEISRKLGDRGLALAGFPAESGGAAAESGGAAAEGGGAAAEGDSAAAAVPAARSGADDEVRAGYREAAGRAAANGGSKSSAATAPREPVTWQPQDEAIDLLGVAGLPVLKRALPAVAGLLALILVVFGLRRRRTRRG